LKTQNRIFLGFCCKFQKEFQSLQGGQIFQVSSKFRCSTDSTIHSTRSNCIQKLAQKTAHSTPPKNHEKNVSYLSIHFFYFCFADYLIFLIIFSCFFGLAFLVHFPIRKEAIVRTLSICPSVTASSLQGVNQGVIYGLIESL
jgi:hypothetical protein